MAGAKEIQNRINSIKDTNKITNAMYLISSSKLKKSSALLKNTEPYFLTLKKSISRILKSMPEIEHIYFDSVSGEKYDGKVDKGYLVLTADKGLAGAYNINVLKEVEEKIKSEDKTSLFVVGEVGRRYFYHRNIKVESHFNYSAQNPSIHRARLIGETLIEKYLSGEVDEIYVCYTRMKNSIQPEVITEQILPLSRLNFEGYSDDDVLGEASFYPSVESVLNHMVPNYVTGFIYGALIEAFCSEQNSRMTAMQSANDNASEMLKELSVSYNRVRQAMITDEINDVIGGVKVLRKKAKKKKGGGI